jgi:hypothetical protein
MDKLKYLLYLAAVSMIVNVVAGGPQSLSDRDRKAIDEITKILPPPEAIELKMILAFPTKEQEKDDQYLWEPNSFARDSKGNYYITDTKANAVLIFDSSGKYISKFGKRGQGPGDLLMPMSINILGDVLIVNEPGNRRLQYFNFQGESKKSIRLFKSCFDLDYLKDGRIVAAPMFIDETAEKALIEVLSPEGKIIQTFGTPFEFKWESYIMNERRLFLNKNDEIIQVFCNLPFLQKYSINGKLLREKHLETEFSFKLEILNRRWNSYLPNERVGKKTIFHDAAMLDDSIYIVGKNLSFLWIWEVDEKFNITRTYWVKAGENFYVQDFLPFKEDGRLKFAFIRVNPDTEVKINVFTPK